MKPLYLSLENFGPYRQRQDIDFCKLDDFFLIYGKTGSGKTTIFDAITYALYGKAIGGRSNLERELGSRFSPIGSKPWVEFEFLASSAQWKVYRSLPYKKRNKRGVESEATSEVELYRMNEIGVYEIIADRSTTANQILLDLLRLSADEFSKIVLLPQGEFQKFLEMKTTERVEILEKLFDVGIYDAVTEAARKKVMELEAYLKAKQEEIERISNELGIEPGSRIKESGKAISEFDKRIEESTKDASQLETQIAQNRERLSFLQSMLAAWKNLHEKEELKPVFDKRETRLEAAKSLGELASLAKQVSADYEELIELLSESLQTGTELSKLEAEGIEIKKIQKGLPIVRKKYDNLQRSVALYQNAVNAWNQKEQCESERRQVMQRLDATLQDWEYRQNEIGQLKSSITEIENAIQSEPLAQESFHKIVIADEAFKRIETWIEQKEKIEAQRVETLRKIREAEDSILLTNQELTIAERNRDRINEEIRKAQAGMLAASLIPGEPCPVCGARDHPNLAKLEQNAPDDKTIKTAQKAVEETKSSLSAIIQDKQNLENRIEEFSQDLQVIVQKISEEWKGIACEVIGDKSTMQLLDISPSEFVSISSRLQSERRELEERLKSYQHGRKSLQELRKTLDQAGRDLDRIQEEKTRLEMKQTELDAHIDSLGEQIGKEDPRICLKEAEENLVTLHNEIEQIEEQAQKWEIAWSSISIKMDMQLEKIGQKGPALATMVEEFLNEVDKMKVRSLLRLLESPVTSSEKEAPEHEQQAIRPLPDLLTSSGNNAGNLSGFSESIYEPSPRLLQELFALLANSLPHIDRFVPVSGQIMYLSETLEKILSAHRINEPALKALMQEILCSVWTSNRIKEEAREISAFRQSYNEASISYQVLAARAQALSPFNSLSPNSFNSTTLPPSNQSLDRLPQHNQENGDQPKHPEMFDGIHLEQQEKNLREECLSLLERKKSIETEISDLRDERARFIAELDQLRRLLSRRDELTSEYERAIKEFGKHQELSKLLGGSLNPQRKMPFKNYVLGLQFREIAMRASSRLYRMSNGRFLVEADILGGSGNQKIGLELYVLDAWNGGRRPVGTLSGGEKFMLSISLALGLADSIQERARANRIESLFIDEGFGSLDEESLSLAISVLEDLRGDKSIAIISHVDELYSRIPSRIVVKKSVGGSHLELEQD